MTVECPKCKTKNPDTQKFCGACATPIKQDVDITEPFTKTLETPVTDFTRGYTFADRYEIIEELGRGGMGRVFRVEDIKSKEEIALKIIKPEISSDKKTIERFRNELNTTRKIRHKNVCGMYHFGEADGTHYITMEYVAGEDLKSLIRRVKQLTVGTAISITKQICEGLSEAHKLGIVHRDLKPSNIMIDKSGNVRIMDFGIARSIKTKGETGTGVMIGTPEYMSPEQVEAKDIDQRSDIYSLSIILYEMLTRRTPFEGDTAFAVALKHKSEEPENPRKLNSHIPEDLSRLILKCLAKGKEDRYQGAEELSLELTKIEEGIPTTEKVSPKSKPFTSREITVHFNLKKLLIPLLAVVAIVSVIFLSVILIKKLPSKKIIAPLYKQLTFIGKAGKSAISPNGEFIAYVSDEAYDEAKVMIQDNASGQVIEVFQALNCTNLQWSPNGSELSFGSYVQEDIWETIVVSRLGGTPRRYNYMPGLIWSPDGTQFAHKSANKEIRFTNRSTGETTSISLEGTFNWLYDIDWSPAGNILLFLTKGEEGNYSIWTIATDGREQHNILDEDAIIASPRWSPDGKYIYYCQANELRRISISPDTGEALRSSSMILSEFRSSGSFSITDNGKKLLYAQGLRYSNLWLLKIQGSSNNRKIEIKQLTEGTLTNTGPSISPDGKLIAFSRRGIDSENIYIMPIEGGAPEQLTFLNSYTACPVWSPDSREIAFGSLEDGSPKVWKVSSKGGSLHKFEGTLASDVFDLAWNPGKSILYQLPGNRNFHVLNPSTGKESPLIKDDSIGWVFLPRYSPDGDRILVHWNRPPERGLWIISLVDSTHKLLRKGRVVPIGWSHDSEWIYAVDSVGERIIILKISLEDGRENIILDTLFSQEKGRIALFYVSMTPDGKSFVFPALKSLSDIWVVENFDPDIW